MPLLSQKVESLLNGVSQLAPSRRLTSQAEEQINALSSVSAGLTKRPPTRYGSKLISDPTGFSNAFVHRINRSDTERWRVVGLNQDLKVYDENGVAQTVTFPDGKTYLASSNPEQDFRAVTVGDTVFIINRGTTVAKKTTTAPGRKFEALVFVKNGDYNTIYRVKVDGVAFEYITPAGDDPGQRPFIDTVNIAKEIKSLLDTGIGSTFRITQYGATLHLERINSANFTVEVEDGLSGELIAIKEKVQRFTDLPPVARDGFTVEVTGDPDTGFDNYYLRYTDSETPSRAGVWQEVVKPQEEIELDSNTMPHVLVRGGVVYDGLKVDTQPAPTCIVKGDPTSVQREGFASTLNGTEGIRVLAFHNDAGFSNLDGATTRSTEYVVSYDAQASTLDPNHTATVEVYANDGVGSTNWTLVGQRSYAQTDGFRRNEQIRFTRAMAQNFDIRVLLNHPDQGGQQISVLLITLHNAGNTAFPGVQYFPKKIGEVDLGSQVTLGGRARTLYPNSTLVRVTLNGSNNDYTTTAEMDADTVLTNLISVINTNHSGNFLASRVAPGILKIEELGANEISTLVCSTGFPPGTTMVLQSSLPVANNALAGLTVTNVTDGSSGTVTSNTQNVIVLSGALTGGSDNQFQNGDSVRVSVGSSAFVFKRFEWAQRSVGDLTTNPFPSFVGKKLSEVFFHANRLAVTAEENVIMTQNGDLTNWFRQTATVLLDTDPVDLSGAHPQQSDFHAATAWGGELILWTELHQFALSGDPVISPKTVRLDMVSSFENTKRVRPLVAGNSVFYAQLNNGVTEVFEYNRSVQRETTNDGDRITGDVPGYILGNPLSIQGSPAHGLLVLRTSNALNTLYIYKYFDQSGQRLQGGWSKWQMTGLGDIEILAVDFLDDTMGVVVKRHDGIFLLTMPINEGATDADRACFTHMDFRVTDATSGVSAAYDGTKTTFSGIPFAIRKPNPVVGLNSATAADGTTIWCHVSEVALGPAWFGAGCGAVGSGFGIISNKWYGRGSAGVTTRARWTGAVKNDKFGWFAEVIRPNVSTATQFMTFQFRSNATADNDVHDRIELGITRVDDNTVSIAITMFVNNVSQGVLTVDSSFNFPMGTTKVIGCDVNGDKVDVWTSPTLSRYDSMTRTPIGTQQTLTTVLNDANHQRFGVGSRINTTSTPAHLDNWGFDNFTVVDFEQTTNDGDFCVTRRDGTGANLVATYESSTSVSVPGDESLSAMYIGVCYNFQYDLSRIYARDRNGGTVTRGRLQLRTLEVEYTDTKALTIEVDPGRTGITLRSYTVTSTAACGASGIKRVPIMSKNDNVTISLKNTTPDPVSIQSFTWEGSLRSRS